MQQRMPQRMSNPTGETVRRPKTACMSPCPASLQQPEDCLCW